ncbi:DUF4838 domain-containing protein [Propionibacteriaceae bacterium Y2011]
MTNVTLAQHVSVPRRTILAGAAAAAALAATGIGHAQAEPGRNRRLINNGVAECILIHQPDASADLLTAITDLADRFEQVTGARPEVSTDPEATARTRIYLGFIGPGAGPHLSAKVNSLFADGFLITPFLDTVTVIGRLEGGTINGIHEFVERYLGVVSLLPTTVGDHIPTSPTIEIPKAELRSEPAFAMRCFSPMNQAPGEGPYPQMTTWAARNRLQGLNHNAPLAFHHNLFSLFLPSKYADRPELYANGKVPASDTTTTGWQPAFTNPETVSVAVAEIVAALTAEPDLTTFSLGVNDGAGYEVGFVPDDYYRWVNDVIAGVRAELGDREITYGLLAYRQVEPVPSFDLDPAVVPFFTEERLAWADDDLRAASQALLQQWQQRAAGLGLYDYLYGGSYLIPRMHVGVTADAYRWAAEHGVIAQYAEVYPAWGEGPKNWVLAKLQWDPSLDEEELTAQWCTLAVGAAAAPSLLNYYSFFQEFWETRAVDSPWFVPGSTYQGFNTLPRYLELLEPEEIEQCQTWIDQAVAAADTAAQQARADALARTWQYYRASALSYPRPVDQPTTPAEAQAILQDAADHTAERVELAAERTVLEAEFQADPLLIMTLRPSRYPQLAWSGWNPSEFWAVAGYLRTQEPDGGPVTTEAERLAAEHPAATGRAVAQSVLDARAVGSLTVNSSFETAGATTAEAPPWRNLERSTQTRGSARDTSQAATGEASAVVTGRGWGGPSQLVPAAHGFSQLVVSYRATTGNVASLQFGTDLLDATGTIRGTVRSAVRSLTRDGEWHQLVVNGEIPANISGRDITDISVVMLVESPADIEVHLDDIELYVAPRPEL